MLPKSNLIVHEMFEYLSSLLQQGLLGIGLDSSKNLPLLKKWIHGDSPAFLPLPLLLTLKSTHIKLNSFSFQAWQFPGSNQGSRFSFLHTFICTSESGFQVPKHLSPSSLDMFTYLLVLIVLKRNGLSSPLLGVLCFYSLDLHFALNWEDTHHQVWWADVINKVIAGMPSSLQAHQVPACCCLISSTSVWLAFEAAQPSSSRTNSWLYAKFLSIPYQQYSQTKKILR